jgi:hypothetical protein
MNTCIPPPRTPPDHCAPLSHLSAACPCVHLRVCVLQLGQVEYTRQRDYFPGLGKNTASKDGESYLAVLKRWRFEHNAFNIRVAQWHKWHTAWLLCVVLCCHERR